MTDSSAVKVGDTVIAWKAEGPVTYGGTDKHGSSFVMVIGRGVNGVTVLCPAVRVAPADTPLADPKDPRITVVKRRTFGGNWQLELPGMAPVPAKTKKAAVNEGQRRLAIADWHAAHHTLLTMPDTVPGLLWGMCACGGWKSSGAVRLVALLERWHAKHVAELPRNANAANE